MNKKEKEKEEKETKEKNDNIKEKKKAGRVYKPKQEALPIYIRKELYELLEFSAKQEDKSLRQFANDLVESVAMKSAFISRQFPHLKLYTVASHSLFIKDYQTKNIDEMLYEKAITVEISVKNNDIYCSVHQSNDCEHIHYALCLDEVSILPLNSKMKSSWPSSEGCKVDEGNIDDNIFTNTTQLSSNQRRQKLKEEAFYSLPKHFKDIHEERKYKLSK